LGRLDPRYRSAEALPESSYMQPEHLDRVSAMPPIVEFRSAPLHRLVRAPFKFCEMKSVVAIPS